jgi:hypothetical protein
MRSRPETRRGMGTGAGDDGVPGKGVETSRFGDGTRLGRAPHGSLPWMVALQSAIIGGY